jgi:hypothetical protein
MATSDDGGPELALSRVLGASASNLAGVLKGRGRYQWKRLALKKGEDGAVLAVLEADDLQEWGPVVAFGRGEGWSSALVNLSKAIAAGRWRADKPYRAGGRDIGS